MRKSGQVTEGRGSKLYVGKRGLRDCWILSRNCRNTLSWYIVDQLLQSAKDGTLLQLAGVNSVKIHIRS